MHCRDVEKSATCNALQVVLFRSDQGAGERRRRKKARDKRGRSPYAPFSAGAVSKSLMHSSSSKKRTTYCTSLNTEKIKTGFSRSSLSQSFR